MYVLWFSSRLIVVDTIGTLYKGVMVTMIECRACQNISSRDEEFYDISLVMKGNKTLRDCLDQFCKVEVLEGDNKYHCDKCNKKQEATMQMKFKSTPLILNIQLKR